MIHRHITLALAAALLGAAGTTAAAQPYAWTENAGWTNWNPGNGDGLGPAFILPSAGPGNVVVDGGLAGFVWAENLGWINLGGTGPEGTPPGPGDGPPYPQPGDQTGDDFGVGIDASGALYGYAWTENAGWINFGPFADACRCDAGVTDCADASCEPAQPRFTRGRLRGYAWAENFGWINFDDNNVFVGVECLGDFNLDGAANVLDILAFVNLWNTGAGITDWNEDGQVNIIDVVQFIADWSVGCP